MDQRAEDNARLGRALAFLRETSGLTQKQVAAKSGVGSTYISLIENGHRGARWETIMRILRAIDHTPGRLGGEILIDEQRSLR